jgi:hypothetical protein
VCPCGHAVSARTLDSIRTNVYLPARTVKTVRE